MNGEGSCFYQRAYLKLLPAPTSGSSVHRRFACCHAGLPVPPATCFQLFQTALEQHQGRIVVPIQFATAGTAMPALRKGFGLTSATGMTFLGAVRGRNQYAAFAKDLCKVLNPVLEHRPAGIADAFGQVMIPDHVTHL